jgi:transcriptional regulator with XRE-family HTH domain
MTLSASRRRELAHFLRTRRGRIQPGEVGLPHTPRRRTPGLRREELALLAGISATWYTYLEQARDVRVSDQVLTSLARVLGLDDSERDHLFLLAHGDPVPDRAPSEVLDPKVARLLHILEPHPAYVTGARWDVLGWNQAAARLFTDFGALPEGHRNMVWWVFTDPAARRILVDWEGEAQALLARFRAAVARHLDDPRFTSLVGELRAVSPEAQAWWPRHDVRGSSGGSKRLRHQEAGVFTLDHNVLEIANVAEQRLVVYAAEPGTQAETALRLLTEPGAASRTAE